MMLSKQRAMAIIQLLDTDHDARRLVEIHGRKPPGTCGLCGRLAPLEESPDPRCPTEAMVSACAWGCDFPCGGYPCDGCAACCPGLRNADFWKRAAAYPNDWWRIRLDSEPAT